MVRLEIILPDVRIGPRGKWVMKDAKTIPNADRGAMKLLLGEMWFEALPPEIHCQSRGTEELTDRLVRGRGAAAAAEFLAIEKRRVTEAEMLGDIHPVRFAVYEGDRVAGGWEWYGITLSGADPVRVRCMPFPAFQRMGLSVAEQMKLTADVCEIFLASEGILIDGALHEIDDVRTFTFTNLGRGSRGDEVTAAWNAEIDGRHADRASLIGVVKTTNDWNREERIITRGTER